jgi:hypothetical protein
VNGLTAEGCRECQRFTAEFASATQETAAIQCDILGRTRAGMDISQTRLLWLRAAQAALHAKKDELDAHRETHRSELRYGG